jgi:hypothetical protein
MAREGSNGKWQIVARSWQLATFLIVAPWTIDFRAGTGCRMAHFE